MKFQTTRSFEADFAGLSDVEKRLFRDALRVFVPACDRLAADPSARWPASLRVRDVEGARGIWEMTWSFAGPAGRATFEFVQIEGALGIRWRRVGGHAIFRAP